MRVTLRWQADWAGLANTDREGHSSRGACKYGSWTFGFGNWEKTGRGWRKRREQVTQNTVGFRKFRKHWKPLRNFELRHVLRNYCFLVSYRLKVCLYNAGHYIQTLFYVKHHSGAPHSHWDTEMVHSNKDIGLSTGPSLIGHRDKLSGKTSIQRARRVNNQVTPALGNSRDTQNSCNSSP